MSGGGFAPWSGPCCSACGLPAVLHAEERDSYCREQVRLCTYGSGDLMSLARTVFDAAYAAGFKAGAAAAADSGEEA